MKLGVLIVVLVGFAVTAETQTLPVRFKNCKRVDMYFLSAEITPEWKEGNQDLITYFNEQLKNYQGLVKADGKIILEVFIYEDGKTCCASFTNNTNSALDPSVFQEVINHMPAWKPARQRGRVVTFLKRFTLHINEGKISSM